MRTHLNQHLNGLIQNSVELRERRLLIFGMRSLSVLQVIFLFVSGAFAFRYVALASTRHSNVAVVTHKSHALIGSNSSYHNGINSSNENAIDSDGHANVVKSISSLLSESLNKSIGHFKYIQEIDENTNKVNLSTIAFNETTPTSTTPCKQSVNYDDNGSSSSSSEQREPTKVSLHPDRRNHTRTTIPMTNYAEDLPKQEVTTNLPMITIDLEADLRESRRDEAKTELKDVKDVVPTVDLRLVNHSTLVKVPVNRVKIRNRWNSTNTVLNETRFDDDYEPTSNQGPRKSSKLEDTPLFPFGARFLSDSFRKTEAISLTKPDKSPSGYQTSIHYVQSPPQSLSHKLSTTDLTHHSEHTKNSTKFICVEIINGQVRHPLFHKEVFPELHTPSLIMPTIPRVPMKYETYVSYNLHHANKSDSDLTTAADRTERERSKFYADQYRPINLDSIEYLRKYPELAKHKENSHKLTDDTVRTSYSRNYDPKSGYIPVSSKLSVENLGSSNPGSSPSSSQVSSTKQIKIEPIVKTGPGIVLPGAPNHSSRSKNSLKTQKQLSSSIDIKHHQHQPPKVPAKPEEYSVEGVTDEDDPDDISVDIPNHSSFNDQSISVPTPIPPSPLLGLMDTMHDQKTLSELLNSHDLLNHHDLSINPLTDSVENRPTSDYLVKQYNSLKSPSLPHSMKDTIAHYNALNRPLTSPYKLSSPEHGIIYYEPQYGFNHDPAMISPYLASIQGTFAQHKNAKSNKKSKSRRTKPSTGSRQSRFLSRVTPEDYKNYNRHFPTISGNSNNKLMYPYGRLSPSAQSMGNKYFLVPSIPAALTAKSAKRKRNSGKVKRNENRRSGIDQMSNSPSVAESIDMPVMCLQDGGNCLSSPSDMNNRRNMIKFELKDALSRT